MTPYPAYEYALSLTSQFYFCGLPLRLDPYGSCLFSCEYCFASARGGRRSPRGLKVANVEALARVLRGRADGRSTVIDEMIEQRQPIHLGGMSDPLPSLEKKLRTTLNLLEVLADLDYPTVISTKSALVAEPDYLDVMVRGDFVLQMSFGTRDDRLASRIEAGTPAPSTRIEALRHVAASGVPTACRLQPLIPGREVEAMEFLDECAEAGVRHIGVEHLKLPLENWSGIGRLSRAVGMDIAARYERLGAQRQGREWVLPVAERLPTVLEMRERTHQLGMSFGAADNDLLPMSDSNCCCSGADALLRGGNPFEHNYLGAVRRASHSLVTIGSIENCWAPVGSLARMVNSRSRLRRPDGSGAGIADYIKTNWNGRSNGCSPAMFFDVEPTGDTDDESFVVYEIGPELQRVMELRPPKSDRVQVSDP